MALFTIFHFNLYCMFLSFNDQMCLLSSVEFLSLLFVNDCVWLPNRSLNVVSVSPIYVSVVSFGGPFLLG